MNKLYLFMFSLLFVGCTGVKTQSASATAPTPTPFPPASIVFTSVKDAITKNLILKCEYTDAYGGKTNTFIQGKTVRIIGADEKTKNINGLIMDQRFYVWEINGKQGLIIDMTKIGDKNPLKMGETAVKNEDDIINVLEGEKDKCIVSPADASFLQLPKEVEFKEFAGW